MTLQIILENLNYLAQSVPWESFFEWLSASGILAALLMPVYKLIQKWFKHHKQVMLSVVGIVSMLVSFGHFIFINHAADPGVVFLRGLAVAFATQPFYQYMIKPLSKIIMGRIKTEIEKAAVLNNEIKSAAMTVNSATPTANQKTLVDDVTR